MNAEIVNRQTILSGWVSVTRLEIRMPNGAVEERHMEDHGDGVVVLPYDVVRKVGLLIHQPRGPVLAAGQMPLLEAPAGRLDGDQPQHAARREALEETGISLGALEFVSTVWTIPSISSEQLHLYHAQYTLSDFVSHGGGCDDENEGISVLEIPLPDIADMLDRGELRDAKTIILMQSLRQKSPKLFVRELEIDVIRNT